MRLTLRTLLAYMDGELERLYPKEAKEIGKKIEDSKFATDLYHKIRDVMRRLRLAAPSISEKGANLDCNTVAEYLDNELPDDRVPDFEEVCLKSEMHLAEVASCHQILAIAQVEPAEVAPESRQRMYQLPEVASRVDEERLAAAEAATVLSGDGAAPASPAPPIKARPRPVVPDYLRDPPKKRRLLPAAAMTLFACAAIALVLVALGQTKPGTPIGNFLDWAEAKISGKSVAKEGDQSGKRPAGDENSKSSGVQATSGSSGTNVKPSGSAPAADSAGAAAPAPNRDTAAPPSPGPAAPTEQPVPPAETIPENPAGPPPIPAASATSAKAPATVAPPPQGAAPISRPAPGSNLPIVPAAPPKAEIKPVPPDGPALPGATAPGSTPPSRPASGTGTSPANPNEIARVDAKAPRGNPPGGDKANVATYISSGQDVLLKYDAANSIWQRVLPAEFLTPNQPLLTLPSYSSQINVFVVGASIELFNGTRIELVRAGADAPLGVDISYGRLTIKPLAQAGARLRIMAGAHSGLLTLANIESVAAFEVTRSHVPGTDPEKDLSRAMTRFYVAKGGASWEENGRPAVRLNGPAGVALDGTPSTPSAEVPKWVIANTVNELDQRAALAVSQALPAERSASLALNEMAEDRRKEVRTLATRSLGYLGQFDPLVLALDDPDSRVAWPDYYDELKEAIARGPETAAAIRQSLEKKFSNDAPALYRMLWGYTDRDLESGDDARLVKYLDSEVLAYRVLAFRNLFEITHAGRSYHPEWPASKRQQPVQRFSQELHLGNIRWTPAATPKPRTPPMPSAAPAAPPSNPPGEDETSGVSPTSALEPIDAPIDAPPARAAAPLRPSQPRPKLVYPEPNP